MKNPCSNVHILGVERWGSDSCILAVAVLDETLSNLVLIDVVIARGNVGGMEIPRSCFNESGIRDWRSRLYKFNMQNQFGLKLSFAWVAGEADFVPFVLFLTRKQACYYLQSRI